MVPCEVQVLPADGDHLSHSKHRATHDEVGLTRSLVQMARSKLETGQATTAAHGHPNTNAASRFRQSPGDPGAIYAHAGE